jgi:HAMP domain-containing protein
MPEFHNERSVSSNSDGIVNADDTRSFFRSWNRSLSAKLVTFTHGITILAMLVVAGTTIISGQKSIEKNFASSSVNAFELLADSFRNALNEQELQRATDTFARSIDMQKASLDGLAALNVTRGELGTLDVAVEGGLAPWIDRFLDQGGNEQLIEIAPDGRHLILVDDVSVDTYDHSRIVLATAWSRHAVDAQISELWSAALYSGLSASLLVGLVLFFVLPRFLSRPLIRAARSLSELSRGNTTVEVYDTERRDEIGGIARAIAVLRGGQIDSEGLPATRGGRAAPRPQGGLDQVVDLS